MDRRQRFIKWITSLLGVEVYFKPFKEHIIPIQQVRFTERKLEPFRLEVKQVFDRYEFKRMQELGIDIKDRFYKSACDEIYNVYKEDFELLETETMLGVECCIRLEIWKEDNPHKKP